MIKKIIRIFFCVLLIFFSVFTFGACSKNKSQRQKPSGEITELGTTDTSFLEHSYITQSLDFALYDA